MTPAVTPAVMAAAIIAAGGAPPGARRYPAQPAEPISASRDTVRANSNAPGPSP